MLSKYTNYIKCLLKLLFVSFLLSNTVSCSFLGLTEPETNGQQLSKRKLSESDKSKYKDEDPQLALNFFMQQPKPVGLPEPELEVNSLIKKQIDFLVSGKQRTLRNNLDRGKEHAKLINQVLIDEGVPGQFIYLAMIESGYQKNLTSPMGAAGMWQFMKSTARLYGLKVTLFKDERKDIVLSTIAAGRHLKDLYEQFADWKLVLAAYNAGPGTVQRAIKRFGTRDFWKLAANGGFRSETVNFVSKFYAINFIMANPESFDLSLDCLTSYRGLNHKIKIQKSNLKTTKQKNAN